RSTNFNHRYMFRDGCVGQDHVWFFMRKERWQVCKKKRIRQLIGFFISLDQLFFSFGDTGYDYFPFFILIQYTMNMIMSKTCYGNLQDFLCLTIIGTLCLAIIEIKENSEGK